MSPPEARALLRQIIATGNVAFPDHARKRLTQWRLTAEDCVNVLRAGAMGEAENENGPWRYPVRTHRIVVVVAFRSEAEVVVVTAWRMER